MNFSLQNRQTLGVSCFTIGLLLIASACGIVASHARLFSQKRDTAVMIGTQLPTLKSTVAILAASVAAEQMFSSQALAAREEQASVYILPQSSPGPRVVSTLQELALALGKTGSLKVEKLTFDPKFIDEGSIKKLPVHLTVRGSLQDVARLLTILGFGGDMMVRDTVSAMDQERFLHQVEASAPLSLSAAEDFLYLDLIEYAANPDGYEQKMLKDMPVDIASALRANLLSAGLADVRSAFQGMASSLRERNLWPMPLFDVQSVTRDKDLWTVELLTYGRSL